MRAQPSRMGFVPLLKRPQTDPSSVHNVRTWQERALYEPQSGPSPDPTATLTLAFRTARNTFLLFKSFSVYNILLK